MTDSRVALVGCGKQKLDTDTPVPIGRLYTSTYFDLKRQYATECCDHWFVLSAEHGLVPPDAYVRPYDTTVDALDADALDEWVAEIADGFQFFEDDDAVVFLAGQTYQAPLDEPLTDLAVHTPVEFPFAQTSGIGEQMRWLKREVARCSEDRDAGQSELAMYAEGST